MRTFIRVIREIRQIEPVVWMALVSLSAFSMVGLSLWPGQ